MDTVNLPEGSWWVAITLWSVLIMICMVQMAGSTEEHDQAYG